MSSAAASTLSATLASASTTGNQLVLLVRLVGSGTPVLNTPSGWTLRQSDGNTTSWNGIFERFSAPSTSSVALSGTGTITAIVACLLEVGGMGAGSADAGEVNLSSSNGTAIASTGTSPATTTQASEIWVALIAFLGNSASISGISSGWTQIGATTGAGSSPKANMAAFYQIVSTTGNPSISATLSVSQAWAVGIETYAPAGGVAGPTRYASHRGRPFGRVAGLND